jgi:Uma2 family endonuclease
MAEPALQRMSLEDFLRFEGEPGRRYELAGGEPLAMAPSSDRHGRLAQNAGAIIERALGDDTTCAVVQGGGILVEREEETRFYVADLVLTCAEASGEAYVREPRLIVEVLSPSTSGIDKHQKVPDYGALPSVEEIWLVESRSRWVLVWQRQEGGWVGSFPYTGAQAFRSRVLGTEVGLDRLYRNTGL